MLLLLCAGALVRRLPEPQSTGEPGLQADKLLYQAAAAGDAEEAARLVATGARASQPLVEGADASARRGSSPLAAALAGHPQNARLLGVLGCAAAGERAGVVRLTPQLAGAAEGACVDAPSAGATLGEPCPYGAALAEHQGELGAAAARGRHAAAQFCQSLGPTCHFKDGVLAMLGVDATVLSTLTAGVATLQDPFALALLACAQATPALARALAPSVRQGLEARGAVSASDLPGLAERGADRAGEDAGAGRGPRLHALVAGGRDAAERCRVAETAELRARAVAERFEYRLAHLRAAEQPERRHAQRQKDREVRAKHAAEDTVSDWQALKAKYQRDVKVVYALGGALVLALLALAYALRHKCARFRRYQHQKRTRAEEAVAFWMAQRGDGSQLSSAVHRVQTCKTPVKAMTWNVAGVSGNVFEFWGLAPSSVIEAVEDYVLTNTDAQVGAVLTQQRYLDLAQRMQKLGWPALPPDLVGELRGRGLVQYLCDASVGKKRLVSLPDRVTAALQAGRPGVTTPSTGDISSLDKWWAAWTAFLFDGGAVHALQPHAAKYAAHLTDQEAALSLPLQLLHLACFDGCLVHVLNQVAPSWMEVKKELLAVDKGALAARILKESYTDYHVVMLQEVAPSMRELIEKALPRFTVAGGGRRGQDSLVCVAGPAEDESDAFEAFAKERFPALALEPGDACVCRAELQGQECLIASYHGDSDGKMTIPFVDAFMQYAGDTRVLLGMDGNMDTDPDKGKLTSTDFRAAIARQQLHSCLRDDVWTTFKARTYVQPQAQKAVLSQNLVAEADRGPKDHVLARTGCYFARCARDTTGRHAFADQPLPTPAFPSDHAIVATEVLLSGVR